ncbi:MAG: NAD-dependent epimerase/dehydratase family protein [bacterium]
MEKVLVTGGAGFIGSHLVDGLLSKGYEITVLDSLLRGNKLSEEALKNVTFVKGDVRDQDLLIKLSTKCSTIFHLAALLGVDIVADNSVETMDVEVVGIRNVVQAAVAQNVEKIIYASTSGVYGKTSMDRSVTEEVILDPRTSYSIAKRYNEIYLAAVYEEKGIQSLALRFFNVYGPRQDLRMVIPRFFKQAINKENITVFGTGQQTRDFTFIDDVVKATIILSEIVKGFEIFNIAKEQEEQIGVLAEKIKDLTKTSSVIQYVDAPAKRYDFEVGRRFGCSAKLNKQIGFKPETSLDEGLQKVYQYHL